MREDLDSGPLDGNDPGGRGGVACVGNETRIVVGADQTEDEDAENVEQEDTDPDTANGEWDVLGRIMGFRRGHSENLGSQKGIGCPDQDRPETGETAQSSRDVVVLGECAGIVL